MNILPELGEIAAAKYGLQMKDPMFRALDKLSQDPKFELIKNVIDDDFADLDGKMYDIFNDNQTVRVLRDFLDVIGVLNGRKGFYSRVENPEPEQNICYWINMLIEEIANGADNNVYTSLPLIGSGIINGQRFRAAIYYILDILGYQNAQYAETVTCKFNTSCYIYGRDLSAITIYGNASGVGTGTLAKTVTFRIYNMLEDDWYNDYQEFTEYIGIHPLYEGDSATITIPDDILTPGPPNILYGPCGIYKLELQHFTTDIEPTFKLTREPLYEAGDTDFRFMSDETSSTSLSYLNKKNRLLVPTTLGDLPHETIGNTTFSYSDVNTVVIPEGVETIE